MHDKTGSDASETHAAYPILFTSAVSYYVFYKKLYAQGDGLPDKSADSNPPVVRYTSHKVYQPTVRRAQWSIIAIFCHISQSNPVVDR